MELKSRAIGMVWIAEMSGRFDALENAKISAWLESVPAGNPACIVLKKGGVTFVDSSVMSLLVKIMKRSCQQNDDLILCRLQKQVRVIFDLTWLNKVFSIHHNEEESLRAFPS